VKGDAIKVLRTKKGGLLACVFMLFVLALMGLGTPALADSVDAIELYGENETQVLSEPEVFELAGDADEKEGDTTEGDTPSLDNETTNSEYDDAPIQKINIGEASISVTDQVFTGNEVATVVDVTYDGQPLHEGVDFELSYQSDHTHAGQAIVLITGIGDRFEGEVQKAFSILPKEITPDVSLSAGSFVYDGTEKAPVVTVKDGITTLTEGVDYDVVLSADHKEVGVYAATVNLKGDYEGTADVEYKITARSIAKAKVTGIATKTFTGKALTQKLAIKLGSTTLKAKRDYNVTYKNNKNAGTASVVIKGTGNYKGSITKRFKIQARSIAKAKVTGIVKKTYTGKVRTQKIHVKLGSVTLKAKRDYSVTYKKNVNAGKALIVIKGTGNYKGTLTKTFSITKRDFSKAKIGSVKKQRYTGANITPKPTVKWGSSTLKLNRDYTLAYKNNKALGTATIIVKGKGNYTSTSKKVTFTIYQVAATKLNVASIATQAWTGSSIQPSPVVTWQGVTLVRNRDYTVSYSNNRYGGTATMTITGKGGFKGSKKVTFYIDGPTYVGRTVYITDTGKKYHRPGCRYLYSSHAIDVGEAQWRGYGPCGVCHP